MNTTAIIAEYNPFHNGHAYHIQEARRQTNADYLAVIMSGDFVQRGEPAIIDKFSRAKMALENGADLVLELPVRYATGSAEFFAGGAVRILNQLGCIHSLCFGSEHGDAHLLKETAAFLIEEPESYRIALQNALRNGVTFPQARERALHTCGYDIYASLLSSPNNILGIEYCKALLQYKSNIEPVTILRKGASYHSMDTNQEICSATGIRTSILQNKTIPASGLPETVSNTLTSSYSKTFPIIGNDFSALLHYQLLSADTWEDLADFYDVPPTLAQRIFRLRYEFQNYESFVSLVKTKNITELSVRRALLHIMLRLKKNGPEPEYARVLGFRKEAAPFLKRIKENSSIPLITKPSEYKDLLQTDIFASQIYHSIVTKKYDAAPYDELRHTMIIL